MQKPDCLSTAWLFSHPIHAGCRGIIPLPGLGRAQHTLRTEMDFQSIPVFRSVYSTKTVHRTVFSETLDLQGFAPPSVPRRSAPKKHKHTSTVGAMCAPIQHTFPHCSADLYRYEPHQSRSTLDSFPLERGSLGDTPSMRGAGESPPCRVRAAPGVPFSLHTNKNPVPHFEAQGFSCDFDYFTVTEVMWGLAPSYQYRKPSQSMVSPMFRASTAL